MCGWEVGSWVGSESGEDGESLVEWNWRQDQSEWGRSLGGQGGAGAWVGRVKKVLLQN